MKILRNFGMFACLSVSAAMFAASAGCVFDADDTPDKVEVEAPDVDTPDAEVDVDIDKNN